MKEPRRTRGPTGWNRDIDGLLCDLDGVLYRGDEPVKGAAEAIARLRDAGVRLAFCTNNSRFTVAQYVEKLGRMGIEAEEKEIVTSAVVTAEVLAARGRRGARAVVIGGQGLREALTSAGIEIDDSSGSSSADLVVVGWDPGFDYAAMRRAAMAARAGAELVATNDDAAFPASDGLWPGAGAILASIEVASGRRAEVMGKPHAPMMDAAAARLSGARHVAVVGDRPETDLKGAVERGWKTILVLSGVTSSDDVGRVEPKPDVVVDSLADL